MRALQIRCFLKLAAMIRVKTRVVVLVAIVTQVKIKVLVVVEWLEGGSRQPWLAWVLMGHFCHLELALGTVLVEVCAILLFFHAMLTTFCYFFMQCWLHTVIHCSASGMFKSSVQYLLLLYSIFIGSVR